ncbi:1861_t:CDS:10, partial [Scutellospora calospora]
NIYNIMSSATMRQKGGRRQDGYQSFPNSNQSHNNRNSKKWNNNTNTHPVNNASRNQSIPPTAQPSANHHNNNTPSSGSNSLKNIEHVVHDEIAAKHMHDRILFLLANFVGTNVIVTVKSGIKYQGLLSRACTESELGVVLKCARKVLSKQDEKSIPNSMISEFIILAKDLMEIYATSVDFSSSEKTSTEREGFRTDADISGRTEIRERELHKWSPDESGETMKESANASWDQFAVNEQLFGLTTDYNEEIYTTKLDRSKADYKERERKAINIANEITRESTTNIHMLEERGYIVEDQMDEEERYGAVVRNRDPNKYTPPHLRKQQEQQSQPNGVVPTVKKPETNTEVAKEAKVKPPEDLKPITKPVQPATISPSSSIPKIPPLSSYRIPEHVMATLHIPRKNGTEAEGKPIEAQIVKAYRQFATSEKERLQQRKQAIFKKEMDGKMAELLKWGQNFKLNSPLPEDLIPILTKDETKRQQLAAKAAAMKPKLEFVKPSIKIEEVQPQKSNGESKTASEKVVSEKPTSAADKAPPQFPPARTPTTTQTNTQYKLNAKAPEWKPNPNAASFTPTPNSSSGDKRSPGSSPFFGNRQLKKILSSLKDGFSPFQKSKPLPNPSTIPPTWPFGQRPFRHHFTVTNNYEDDIYSQAAVNQNFGFAAYPVAAPYRYPSGTQFVGVPPMPMQQATPMPYLQPGFVPGIPFTTATPMPPTGAPPTIYSPQISSMIPQHFGGSQGFQSPGRNPIVPAGIHPQIYQPYQNQHGIPPMIRYPPDMVPHVPPNGVMMNQRPMILDPHYNVQPEATPMVSGKIVSSIKKRACQAGSYRKSNIFDHIQQDFSLKNLSIHSSMVWAAYIDSGFKYIVRRAMKNLISNTYMSFQNSNMKQPILAHS